MEGFKTATRDVKGHILWLDGPPGTTLRDEGVFLHNISEHKTSDFSFQANFAKSECI